MLPVATPASSISLLRRLVLLVGALLLARAGHAQAPVWQQALSVGDGYTSVFATAADAAGNAYLVGSFSGTVTLGSTTLSSAGLADVFVAKWSAAQSAIVWAKRAGGAGYDYGRTVAVRNGVVYVGGDFSSPTADFGPTTLANSDPTSTTLNGDLFVAQVLDAGPTAAFGWALRAGGLGPDYGLGLAVSGPNVYLAGAFYSNAASFGATTLATAGGSDAFVAKVVDAGATASFAWALQAGGTDTDEAAAVAVSGPNVYVTGLFRNQATFGRTVFTSLNQSSDVYVAKVTDAGATAGFAWALQGGGFVNDGPFGLAVNGSSVYAVGYFGSSATFGSTALQSVGSSDAFVAKVTDAGATGAFAWAQRAGGASGETAYAVAVSGATVYVGGEFYSPTAPFGSVTLTNTTTNNQADLFVAKLTDQGSSSTWAGALSAGSVNYDVAGSLALSPPYVYVGGFAAAGARFGPQIGLARDGGLLATIADATLTASAPAHGGAAATLFPNPAHGRATVLLPDVSDVAPATLTVLDALGRPVLRQTARPPRAELDLRGLAPGLYAVRVAAGGHTATRRLVVE